MAITINGLSARQKVFADVIWACNGRDEVSAFIRGLPQKFRREATLVLEMMIASVFDECHTVDPEVIALIDKLR